MRQLHHASEGLVSLPGLLILSHIAAIVLYCPAGPAENCSELPPSPSNTMGTKMETLHGLPQLRASVIGEQVAANGRQPSLT
jgi:hypothetical protein